MRIGFSFANENATSSLKEIVLFAPLFLFEVTIGSTQSRKRAEVGRSDWPTSLNRQQTEEVSHNTTTGCWCCALMRLETPGCSLVHLR